MLYLSLCNSFLLLKLLKLAFQCLLCTNCISFFNPWANFVQQAIKSRIDHKQIISTIALSITPNWKYISLISIDNWNWKMTRHFETYILMLASHEKLKCGDKLTVRQVSWSRCMFQRVWELYGAQYIPSESDIQDCRGWNYFLND